MRRKTKIANELNINLTQISARVEELTTNLKNKNEYFEETCEESEEYVSEDDEEEESEEEDEEEEEESDSNKFDVEVKQPTEIEMMEVRNKW